MEATETMRLASYMIASFNRPGVLRQTLQVLQQQRIPAGWALEIVVAAPLGSRCEPPDGPARIVWAQAENGHTDVGCQNQAGLEACSGEIILRSGDDDLHDPDRLEESIAALEAKSMAGYSSSYRVHAKTGAIALWSGPADHIGAGMAYRTEILRETSGWPCCEHGADGQLRKLLAANGHKDVANMGHTDSAYLWVGESNRSQDLPWPAAGDVARKGLFEVTGKGQWSDRAWPAAIDLALRTVNGARKVSVIGSAWGKRGEAIQLRGIASWIPMAEMVAHVAHVELIVSAYDCSDAFSEALPDGVRLVRASRPGIGHQLNEALEIATGDIIVGAPCDDIQSPMRLHEILRAHDVGVDVTHLDSFVVINERTGALARWDGDGRYAGNKSYRADLLREIGGWVQLDNGSVDHPTVKKIEQRGAVFRALPEYVGVATIMPHKTGSSRAPEQERPWPPRGVTQEIGRHFRVTGL